MPSLLASQHPDLCAASERAVNELFTFSTRLDRLDGIDHEQHRVYLGRAERLGGHLRAGLLLTRSGLHGSALSVIRTALEHHLQDRLLHLGNRYAVKMKVAEDHRWSEIQAEYEAQLTRWSRTLAQPPERNTRGVVTLVYRGIADHDADPATTMDLLHPLYFEMDKYSPTRGRPADQANFDDGSTFLTLEHRERLARENRDRWHRWLSWGALRDNLELNGMFTGRDLVAIDVHYAFLSGFTHATNAAYDAVFDNWGSISERGTGHFAEELVHLYVASLAASELRLLNGMEDRDPEGSEYVIGVAPRAERSR